MLVGTAVAAYDGAFHAVSLLAALLSGLFLQVGANFFNEYFDYRYGLDHSASLGASTVIFRHEMTAYLAGMRSTLFEFCLPTRATAVPSSPDWLHEVKYAGYRHVRSRREQTFSNLAEMTARDPSRK